MKKLFLLLCLSLSGTLTSQESPNIVVFLVDDMGWVDTSVPFSETTVPLNERYHTPNMERLAAQGVKFTNAYATPVCTPSRISFLTGMNAAHHGVTNWTTPNRNSNSDNADEEYAPAPWNFNGLNPESVTNSVQATPLPEILKDHGYFTVHAGKAHFAPAGTPGSNPVNLGFLVNITGTSAGRPMSYLGSENFGNLPGNPYSIHAVQDMTEYYGSETYLTKALTLEALKALEYPIETGQPFFLNMAHYALHDPYDPDKRFLQKYLDAGLAPVEAVYASMIEGMDKSLGDIMDFLEEKGVADNTVILFMSDNGGLSLAPPRAGEPHIQNAPLREGKGSVYEGGIRVPMLVSTPTTGKSAVVDIPVIIEDFFPSILELAGVEDPQLLQQVDGESFVRLLNGYEKAEERALIWHYPNKWQSKAGQGINYKSAIRKGNWKLVYHMKTGQMELFNLKEDLSETTDLLGKHPKKVRELAEIMGTKLKLWNAPMPVVKKTGKAVEFPGL